MSAKILFVSDMHKRYKDSSSIKGQVEVQQLIQEDILDFIAKYGITHMIPTGDWYDRGFHGTGQAFSAIEMDRRISNAVNGNVYLCLGNHFYLERDDNPEMYIIQPNDMIQPQIPITMPKEPIFKLVPRLKIGTVQIDFFHYNKINKAYIAERDEDTTFHVGVYHDDCVVPAWVREMDGYSGATTQEYMNSIYRNIDFAVHGHIHSKVGITSIQLADGRKVPMSIPGALTIVQNKECHKHSDVDLPVLEIHDDGSYNLQVAKFKTHIDMLRFYATKKKSAANPLADGNLNYSQSSELSTSSELRTLNSFLLKKGYNNKQMNIVNAAMNDTLTVSSAIGVLMEVNKIE